MNNALEFRLAAPTCAPSSVKENFSRSCGADLNQPSIRYNSEYIFDWLYIGSRLRSSRVDRFSASSPMNPHELARFCLTIASDMSSRLTVAKSPSSSKRIWKVCINAGISEPGFGNLSKHSADTH